MIDGVRRLIFSATIKDGSIVIAGNLTSSVLGIVFTILVARFLGPSDWGLVAAVGNLITILAALGDIGLGSAFFQIASGRWSEELHKERIYKAYKDLFTLRLIIGILVFLILLSFSNLLSQLIFKSNNYFLVLSAALGFLFVLLLDFQVFSIEAKKDWKAAAILISLSNVFRIGLLLIFYLLGSLSLESILLIFSGSTLLVFLISLLWIHTGVSSNIEITKTYKEVFKFSSWMGLNKIVSAVSPRLDVLLIIQLAGTYQAGIYGAASRLAVGIPIIIGSLATIIASRFASISDGEELKKYFNKSIGLSFVISLFVVLGIFVVPFVISLFGEQYKQSNLVLQGLLVAYIPFVLSMPAVNILIYHFKKPQIVTILSFFQLPIVLSVNYFLIPKIGIFAPVIVLGIINLLTMIVTYFYALKAMSKKDEN